MKRGRSRKALVMECLELVLPWLTPIELANIALCCKYLRKVADSVTKSRSSDAAGGMESHPIPFVNPQGIPSSPYSFFLYIPSALRPPLPFLRRPWGLRETPSQGRVSVRLKIVKHAHKGWCLCSDELVPQGTFVCDYAGELLTTEEARRRQEELSGGAPALLVVREHLPSGKACLRLNIDATAAGNVARFINHSCDGGNLSTHMVRSPGSLLPRLSFFASEDIPTGHELTFSYGGPPSAATGKPCFCSAPCCSGWLPSDPT